jgi:hypothetical protein
MVGASAIAALGLLVSLDGAPRPQSAAPHISWTSPASSAAQGQAEKLYKKLFEQASPEERRALAEAMLKSGNKSRVLCGLTLLPADPSIDSSMSKRLGDPAVEPKIRRIEPTVCRGDR